MSCWTQKLTSSRERRRADRTIAQPLKRASEHKTEQTGTQSLNRTDATPEQLASNNPMVLRRIDLVELSKSSVLKVLQTAIDAIASTEQVVQALYLADISRDAMRSEVSTTTPALESTRCLAATNTEIAHICSNLGMNNPTRKHRADAFSLNENRTLTSGNIRNKGGSTSSTRVCQRAVQLH